jgi:hypothetical protein
MDREVGAESRWGADSWVRTEDSLEKKLRKGGNGPGQRLMWEGRTSSVGKIPARSGAAGDKARRPSKRGSA